METKELGARGSLSHKHPMHQKNIQTLCTRNTRATLFSTNGLHCQSPPLSARGFSPNCPVSLHPIPMIHKRKQWEVCL